MNQRLNERNEESDGDIETTLISDTKFVGPTFKELRAMGVQLALDDFGAGFCGLGYLRHFEIDKVKVDKSIIDHAFDDPKSLSVLTGVARIAKESMIGVVVEGWTVRKRKH